MKISVEFTKKDLKKIGSSAKKLSKIAGKEIYKITEKENGTKVYTYFPREKFENDLLYLQIY